MSNNNLWCSKCKSHHHPAVECVAKNFPAGKVDKTTLEDIIKIRFGFAHLPFFHDNDCPCKETPDDGDTYIDCKCSEINEYAQLLATEIRKWIREQTAEIYKKQYPEFDSIILREPQIAVMNYIKDLRKALEAIGE